MSRFVGIRREHVFSPGRVEDDAAILEMAADRLRERGHAVEVFGGDDARWPEPTDVTTVFTMAQGARALERLQHWERRGIRIINSPQGILNCQRHRTVSLWAAAGIGFPDSVLMQTDGDTPLPSWVEPHGAWVKRGDFHATQAEDVVRVQSMTETREALRRFHARGIVTAVVQRHVPGTVMKFYAVAQQFFHCVHAGDAEPLPAAMLARLQTMSARAAAALHVDIYGGDCVYDADGNFALIDLNDWPSYAPCRAEAATEIAAFLHARDVASGR